MGLFVTVNVPHLAGTDVKQLGKCQLRNTSLFADALYSVDDLLLILRLHPIS